MCTMLRRWFSCIAHWCICSLVLAFGSVILTLSYLVIALTILADKVWPNAQYGNCWTYTLPRWKKYGGYLLIRPADEVRFLDTLPVPHVIWVQSFDTAGSVVSQFYPEKRNVSRWMPWFTIYYKGKVLNNERNHPAKTERSVPE